MAEIDMPPQYAGEYSDPKDTEGKVAEAVRTMAADRVNQWTTFVLDAITEFESNANGHIEKLDYDEDATYSFDPVLKSFATVVIDFFPEIKEVETAYSAVSEVMDGIQSSYEQKLQSGLAGAKLRLHESVRALVQAARERATLATPAIVAHLAEAVEDGMTWVDSASTDPDYVSALCDWMGFPIPTRENTIRPVRQSLENPFFGVYQAVRAQLLRTRGVPGLSDDVLNPIAWEHEAVESQRELYGEQGEGAWEKSYEGTLPDRFSRS
jgi:hypothetical protein